ncbi:electron transfer flavoprotein beta subunit lysine methyltransferase [Monodelphis domestica]|uniref:Electron transfer flavoprotein beta subunit lysine methyltransferase n=1 Tax=Monodelphis domestica TaxID=13616 RepID=F6VG35_MONDO|nr:electron transfer flavoprotein beta subunit lysine methyltransferase [Monodelphis domestica]XP_007502595.1 electron transfer flavoprotein beta subunit lysine methyltransferase [Monodelphis domestica]XP_007502596.1 electron transfer flavoprotein beta subunit lysine methyltransferase [Monodelphis domestica]XP_016281027.1 electron transfer flavoprotein beta subunit lysine methyltransferase [Monodelphis domestica]XP_056653348.1 electron transfer flavoprotein beta subunit lysine methyltransferase
MALGRGWTLAPRPSCSFLGLCPRTARRPTSAPSPWRQPLYRAATSFLGPEGQAFLEENTEVTNTGNLTPEIRLRLLTPRCRFWRERGDLWPYSDPYWAIYWPGGQALTRYLLDNPDVVRGRSLLDVGSGCGATAIAAKMSGASRILANDVDPIAGLAASLNCKLNNLDPLPTLAQNLLDSEPAPWEVIVLGDMFYDTDLADRLLQWLRKCMWTHGTRVLIGDPGRPQFCGLGIHNRLEKLITYSLPEPTGEENYSLTTSSVWNLQP